MDFIVGDTVECVQTSGIANRKIYIGLTGTVCRVFDDQDYVGVEWDKPVEGHTCSGRCADKYGWNVPKKCVRIIESDDPFSVDESMTDFLSGFSLR